MNKKIIIYSSVDGHTKSICEKIVSFHKDQNIEIISLNNAFDIDLKEYSQIIIGASIRYGKYKKELFNFIENNKNILSSKNNAFFSVNVVARKPDKNLPKTNPYIQKFLEASAWSPQLIDVFAGKIEYPKYNIFDRSIIKFIMWMTKGPTDTTRIYEFTDWSRVRTFSSELEKINYL